jgi:cytochrome c5
LRWPLRRRIRLLALLPGTAALAIACGGGLPHANQADAAFAAQRWPGTTLEALNQGRSLYVRRCGTCHSLYDPAERDEAAWRESVQEMRERAHLDAGRDELILRYLVAVGTPHVSP